MGISGGFTQLDQNYAAARVAADGTSDGTTDPDSYREGRCTNTTLPVPGTGSYVVTLNPGIDAAEADISVSPIGGALNANAQAIQTSDTSVTVTTGVGAVATDIGFMFRVRKLRSAQ